MNAHRITYKYKLNGVELTCSPRNARIIREIMGDFRSFLSLASDGAIEIDWKAYVAANDDEREALNLALEAAGILTRRPKGAYGIYPIDDPEARYYWGPWCAGDRFYFTDENLESAFDFMDDIIPAIAAADHEENVRLCGPDVAKQDPPPLEIRRCIEGAQFETIVRAVA